MLIQHTRSYDDLSYIILNEIFSCNYINIKRKFRSISLDNFNYFQ
jgi:hypothetical protein